MLFNSHVFLFAFLPAILALWWGLGGGRARLLALTLFSYFFYAWWDWRFLPLMIVSTGVDYVAGQYIADATDRRARRPWLIFSLTANLGLLGFFKYFDFFAASFNQAAHSLHLPYVVPILGLTLPIGISFYTFNSMSYTIDLHRGSVAKARSYLHYSAFVAMFPHLIAGPIVRYADVGVQLHHLRERLSWTLAGQGLHFFVLGLIKKVLIADRLALVVNPYFDQGQGAAAVTSWLAVLAYSLQLYFDFSGYSDMAVGLALMLGIRFPQNFDSPYQAGNISEFWRRWHISLSTWLRDYLFIPLGGSSGSLVATARNLTIVMFLGGLWHGAHWNFVVWGLYHGCLLAVHRTFRDLGGRVGSVIISRFLTFLCVTAGWAIFRSASLEQAGNIWFSLAGGYGFIGPLPPARHLAMVMIGLAITQFAPNSFALGAKPRPAHAYALAALLVITLLLLGRTSPFLYFQF